MKKTLKITAITLAVLLGVLLLTVGGYVLYVVFQYDRIEDNLPLAGQRLRRGDGARGERT